MCKTSRISSTHLETDHVKEICKFSAHLQLLYKEKISYVFPHAGSMKFPTEIPMQDP